MLGLPTPVKLVHFAFNKNNQLQSAYIHFAYDDRDSAVYEVGILLGQGYSTKEEDHVRKYNWKLGDRTVAQLQVGMSSMQPWTYLTFLSTTFAEEVRKCGCR
jgi:hypothetical protein